jgi:caffeoyl-CoA O-methyltransferase
LRKLIDLDFLHPSALDYSEKYSDPDTGLLARIAADTKASHPHAHMLSSSVQGRLLELISKLIMPAKILEIGTFTGYSALCLASGLTQNGELHTIELRKEDADRAREYFKLSVWNEQIILHLGNALELVPSLEGPWDLVFIDADKVSYVDYFKLLWPKVRRGGIVIADNVLFHGEVLEESIKGKNARAIQAFNEFIKEQEGAEKLLLTVRDGLYLIRKK